jgi:asparagine synthetase B (glutamine-hydrolysing)
LRAPVGRLVGWRAAARPPTWLTPFALEQIGDAAWGSSPAAAGARRPGQATRLLDPRIALGNQLEAELAAAEGMEVRRPFRDRRLVELAFSLPAHQLYRPGWNKWVARRAMGGLLPEAVRWRRRRSTLYPLFRRGLAERERATARALLEAPGAAWSRYVDREWMNRFFPGRILAGVDGPAALAAWQCFGFELWRRRLAVASSSAPAGIRLVS